MKKFKKLVSGVVSASMLLGCLSVPALATEQTPQEVPMQDEVVYQILDGKTQELITTYQSDIDAGHWNVEALGEDSPVVFEDFPMRSGSSVSDYAELTVTFEYLKTLSANDSAIFTVTNRQTNEEYLSADLKETPKVELPNLPIGDTYMITLSETFDGETVTYTRFMTTENKRASMPFNVSLTPVGETEGVQATMVEVVEMNPADEETYVDDNGKEITVVQQRSSAVITPQELPAYYGSLPSDRLYKVFAGSGEAYGKTFSGFISTYPGGSEYGIFEPGFSLSKEEPASGGIATFALSNAQATGSYFTEDQILSSPNVYTHMWDAEVAVTEDSDFDAFVVQFTPEAYTAYQVELIGNNTVGFEVWYQTGENSAEYSFFEEANSTLRMPYESAIEETMYFAIYFREANNWEDSALFRIKATEYNEQSNSYYDLMNAGTRQACDALVSERINYRGDTDYYYLNNVSDVEEISASGTYHIDFSAIDGNSNSLIVRLLREANGLNGKKLFIEDYSWTVLEGSDRGFAVPLTEGTNYFIAVHSGLYASTSNGDAYQMLIKDPYTPDPYESNDDAATATVLTGTDELNDACLHKDDVDYYTFEVEGEPKNEYISIFWANMVYYNLTLLDDSLDVIATGTVSSGSRYNVIKDVMLDPGTYYIRVDNIGLGSDAYSATISYKLNLEVLTVEATVWEPVALTYTAGQTVSMDTYLATVLEATDCYVGSYIYSGTSASDNSALFIMNGTTKTPMTAEALAALPNGTYTVILEFFGKEATGEAITLTVTGNAEVVEPTSKVEINLGLTSPIDNEGQDWVYAAQTMGNYLREREGLSAATVTVSNALLELTGSSRTKTRQDLEPTYSAVCYFYTNGTALESENLDTGTNVNSVSATRIRERIENGEIFIMHLADETDTTNVETMRYIIIAGIDESDGTALVKVYDPIGFLDDVGNSTMYTWVPLNTLLYGGYVSNNANIMFSGTIIVIE